MFGCVERAEHVASEGRDSLLSTRSTCSTWLQASCFHVETGSVGVDGDVHGLSPLGGIWVPPRRDDFSHRGTEAQSAAFSRAEQHAVSEGRDSPFSTRSKSSKWLKASCFHVETGSAGGESRLTTVAFGRVERVVSRGRYPLFSTRSTCSIWPQASCFHVETDLARARVRSEKNGGFASAGCSTVFEKSMLDAFRRGGVPVLRRISLNPSRSSDALRRSTAGRPSPPEGIASRPMKMRPRRDVPVVRMTARAGMKPWLDVITPVVLACPEASRGVVVSISTTASSSTCKLA